MTGRRVTTISLDETSYEQSKQIGNLSAFVRQQLQEHADQRQNMPVDYHNAMHPILKICHPHKALDGYCEICWPYGTPSKNEWLFWHRDALSVMRQGRSRPEPPKRLPDRRPVTHSNQVPEQEGSNASMNKGIIRKLWSFIF
jgi:hypothetical protein|tara:strand:+ start:2322 stop:2747 length:426 start_codon:yes stop_codon:yes gene_type:complete